MPRPSHPAVLGTKEEAAWPTSPALPPTPADKRAAHYSPVVAGHHTLAVAGNPVAAAHRTPAVLQERPLVVGSLGVVDNTLALEEHLRERIVAVAFTVHLVSEICL